MLGGPTARKGAGSAGTQGLMRRSQLAGEPIDGVCLLVHRKAHALGVTAGAALGGPLFKAVLTGRDPDKKTARIICPR